MGDNIADPNSVFAQINAFFDCLPLAAAIEDRFLCLSSGIGSISSLLEVRDVVRPIKVRSSQTVMDLLWSGTRDEKRLNYESKQCSDEEIEEFLENNGLEMLINTRDGLPQGVDEEKHTLSIFSVANFAQSNNKAGILKINKNLSLVPYLLGSSPTKKGSWVADLPPKTAITFTSVEADFRSSMFQLQ
jgi:arsenate reductase-like glutaredoxin family protein